MSTKAVIFGCAGTQLGAAEREFFARANPAGFIIWAIENNLSIPLDFESSHKRHLREAREQAAEDQRRRALELHNLYDEYCHRQISERLEHQYAGAKLDAALRENLKIIRREQPDWFAQMPENIRTEVAMGRLRSTVRDSLNLPGFEDWLKLNPQERLF